MMVKKYHPSWDGVRSQRLVVLEEPTLLLPDLCDHCFEDITSHFQGDDIWLEIERREDEFRRNCRVVGFKPIIKPTAEALSYCI